MRKERKEKLSAGEEKNKEADQIEEAIKKIASDKERLAKLQNLAKRVKVVSQKSSADVTNSELYDKEVEADIAAANEIIEKAFTRVSEAHDTALHFFSRPNTLSSSVNKPLPRNPFGFKILKWLSDQKTHVLILIRTNGEVRHISRNQALGLSVEDLQDLLELTLCRDEDDTDSLDFELQFKGQVRELLMRQ